MGLDWSNIKYLPIEDVDAVPLGEELPSWKDGSLLSINTGGKVYQMQSGKRRWIPDPETFNAMGLDWSNIKYLPIEDVDTVPLGEDLPSRKDDGNANNRKPVITSFPDFQMPYNGSFILQNYANQLQIADPDGDAIQFYEISVDPTRIDMEAWTLEGQPRGKYLIPADQFNSIKFYGSVLGSNPVVIRAFDGKEWSDPKSFNINVVASSNSGGVGITPGNGGSVSPISPSPTPTPVSGKGNTIRTGGTGLAAEYNGLLKQIEQLKKDINAQSSEISNSESYITSLQGDNKLIDEAIPQKDNELSSLEKDWWAFWNQGRINELKTDLRVLRGQRSINDSEIQKASSQIQISRNKKSDLEQKLAQTEQELNTFEKKNGHYINISKRNWSDIQWENALNSSQALDAIRNDTDKDLRKLYTDICTEIFGSYVSIGGAYDSDEYYDETGGGFGFHGGIDISGGWNVPAKSVVDGTVVWTEHINRVATGYGDVTIKDNKTGRMYIYRHLKSSDLKMGDPVKLGQEVGKVGNTGATFIHLHYEVVEAGKDKRGEVVDRLYEKTEAAKQKVREQTANPLQDYWKMMWLGQ